MIPDSDDLPLRFVIHHIHPTSARLRFLLSGTGHVVLPKSLPALSDLLEQRATRNLLATHPAPFLSQLCQTLQLPAQSLSIVNEFRCWVEIPGANVPVYLLKVTTEAPFAPPEGCRWIELLDSYQLVDVERLILRRVYDFLLGHE